MPTEMAVGISSNEGAFARERFQLCLTDNRCNFVQRFQNEEG